MTSNRFVAALIALTALYFGVNVAVHELFPDHSLYAAASTNPNP